MFASYLTALLLDWLRYNNLQSTYLRKNKKGRKHTYTWRGERKRLDKGGENSTARVLQISAKIIPELAGWEKVKRKAKPVSEVLFTPADQQVWIKGKKDWDVRVLQKQNILLSTLSIRRILSFSLSLSCFTHWFTLQWCQWQNWRYW